jgi:23S rRNA pseudouridine1911/1915/1917 synthase
MTQSFEYPEHLAPARLDKAMAVALGLGLRRCRALIEAGLVLVDERPFPKGGLVGPGQRVSIAETVESRSSCPTVAVVARSESYAALAKPAALHSVAGRGGSCLESCLPGLGLAGWQLLNRLDYLTSGLVLAAAGDGDFAAYKVWQDEGLVCKWYLALVHEVVLDLEACGRILDDKRRVVRVTDEDDEPLRRTWAKAVADVDGKTLLLVRILKGRRHQIRAHLAHAGHPLVGDPVYGAGEAGGLFLHHWRVDMPGFSATWLPDWPGVDPAQVESVRLAFPMPQDG